MIHIKGDISVRTIYGRHGPFNVGTLVSDIGEFAIKDRRLDELDEGLYPASCAIERIGPSYYCVGNRVVTEIRAFLADLDLLTDDPASDCPSEMAEPDPMDNEPPPTDIAAPDIAVPAEYPSEAPEVSVAEDTETLEPSGSAADLSVLFGHLWPLDNTVQLDTTVDRALFRGQIEYLKGADYAYEATQKTWIRNDAS